MKKTQQQQYTFDEFDQHISLWNIIPAGKGNSLVLLRKIVDGIQNGFSDKNPTLVIAGEGARTLGIAMANSICSEDIREISAKYLMGTKDQMEFYRESLFGTVHIISNPGQLGMNESVLWHFLRNRVYKFTSFDRKNFEYIHAHGIFILIAKDIKLIPPSLISAVDFKVIIEPYTQQELELIVHQRLKFCGIFYGDEEMVLKTIIEYGNGQLNHIIDFLKICILMVRAESREELTMKIVERASKLV